MKYKNIYNELRNAYEPTKYEQVRIDSVNEFVGSYIVRTSSRQLFTK
jgi:hypothetical protein